MPCVRPHPGCLDLIEMEILRPRDRMGSSPVGTGFVHFTKASEPRDALIPAPRISLPTRSDR